jgi:spermidine synthase
MARHNTGWRRWLPAWLARSGADGAVDGGTATSAALLVRGLRHTELKFAGSVTQSRMRTLQPHHLLVPYTRTMMASLLFRPRPRRIGMIGLGGGSQAKFCHRYLPETLVEAAENNPEVVAMRRRFRIPDDDARLRVFLADGQHFLGERRGRYDILLVDAYDPQGIPPALSTQRWYDQCRDALAPHGVMAANLFCGDADRHVEKLRRSFGNARVVVLQETRMSNRVAFAWRGDALPAGPVDVAAATAPLPRRVRRELAPEFAAVAAALSRQRRAQR